MVLFRHIGFVSKRLISIGDKNFGIISGGRQGHGHGGENLIREEKGVRNWILENIGVKKLMKSQKPTKMTEECSERSDRMVLRKP